MIGMNKMQTAAFDRLKLRAARLVRLIQLEAPLVVLANEAALVADAGKMLDPERHFAHERDTYIKQTKRMLGLCVEDDCEALVAWRESATSGAPPGPFHSSCCLKHATELAADFDAEDFTGEPAPTLKLVED